MDEVLTARHAALGACFCACLDIDQIKFIIVTLLQRRCGWQGSGYWIPLLGRRTWASYQVTVATMVSKKSGRPPYYKPKTFHIYSFNIFHVSWKLHFRVHALVNGIERMLKKLITGFAGRYVEYEGLTMATVRGAGHTVPQDKPAEALVLIKSFLSDTQLPAKNNWGLLPEWYMLNK